MLRRDALPARSRLPVMAALAAALLAGLLPCVGSVERLELRAHDQRFRWRRPRPSSAKIAIIALDEPTLEEWSQRPMAFWGNHYARIIGNALHSGAAWIAFDIVPATEAEISLHQMVADAFDAINADGHLSDADLDALTATQILSPDSQFLQAIREAGRRVVLSDPAVGQGLADSFREAAGEARAGFVEPPLRVDEAVRTASLLWRDGRQSRASLPALLAACVRGDAPQSEAALRSLARGRVQSSSPGRDGGQAFGFWINYRSKPFPVISARDAAAGRLTPEQKEALRGAVVLVGAMADGFNDQHRIAGGKKAYGVEIHAESLATLLDGRALWRGSGQAEGALAAALALLSLLALAKLSFGGGLLAILAAAGLWAGAAVHLFTTRDILLPVAAPLLGLGAVFATFHSARSLAEGQARRRVEDVFGEYVSDEIRDYVLSHPEHLELGGMEGEATVLFFDMRDSVRFAEKRAPSEVIAGLNMLFAAVVPVIRRHSGLLYRYTGDGFLAVFGAPYPLQNHAQAAYDAAVEIVQAVYRLNAMQEHGRIGEWRAGCGLHSGPLVYGNMGTEQRKEFAVIGDAVNLAARLEGLNKEYGSQIILSQTTYSLLETPPAARGPLEHAIAGREEGIRLYSVSLPDTTARAITIQEAGIL